ncbi:isoprenoid synthase domain-containing protein [Fimicolochytrium jonesii]|uniref:isoprenoid synthase domain-containing protein n=1 Tax=Fimicolochytrium jonesii TaxID=1396493 RepID=UPI0022FDF69D|nr:isoprenoid synthase domain-containing protein [Fimicolochytrium jonesii]KAI8827106.1 isoprenoid synthase domain-containing protein [Fimicolochytrium jonesii]
MSASALLASATHPSELYALFHYIITAPKAPSPAKTIKSLTPSSPSYTYAKCYDFLNLTSRSFARVIQELDAELRHPVCIFYLVLRGLDTVEDDMTLGIERKKEVLEKFHELIYVPGWNFQESGEGEKDRALLVEFEVVIAEFLKLKESYQLIIADITKRMGHGMSSYVSKPTSSKTQITNPAHLIEIQTTAEYNLYTHYVAGLVGIGLTNLFVASGLENPTLASPERAELANEMGQFLQKVNILKDFLEDLNEGRIFWPKDVWEKYVPADDKEVEALAKAENLDRALACLNALVLDALKLVPSCLEYMAGLRNPTVFQFCAIPQMMAIASLNEFFNNPAIFQRVGTKIRRGLAVKLMLASTDMDSIKRTYHDFALSINQRNAKRVGTNKEDESFFGIAVACADIVRWTHIHDKSHPSSDLNSKRIDSGYALADTAKSALSGPKSSTFYNSVLPTSWVVLLVVAAVVAGWAIYAGANGV